MVEEVPPEVWFQRGFTMSSDLKVPGLDPNFLKKARDLYIADPKTLELFRGKIDSLEHSARSGDIRVILSTHIA